jgi:glycosyltransferase involved in cell wall biosynthesis
VGGGLDPEQRSLSRQLGIPSESIVELPFLARPVLAAVYRRSAALLAPSEREGFGWPVVEAMACGTPVVASDIPAFREVGGDAVTYVGVDDLSEWVEAVDRLLRERADAARWQDLRAGLLARARVFSLEAYARGIMAVYREVLGMRAG